jgi:hypothetical protein
VQFSIRDVLWLMTGAALVLALIYTKRSLPTPVASPATSPIGRYQMMSDPKNGWVFLLESATGRTWRYYSTEKVWEDTKSPAVIE